MAELANANRAYVNCSSSQIPIYNDSAKTEQIGTIYPNEMYCTYTAEGVNPNYWMMPVVFRNSNGQKVTGMIQRAALPYSTEPAYLAQQVYFHRRNSNGTTLVNAQATTFPDGNPYMIFTVKKTVSMYEGTNYVRNLPVGTRIALDSSTVGQEYPHRISIDYIELTENNTTTWVKKTNHWVDLSFHAGSSPNNRALY